MQLQVDNSDAGGVEIRTARSCWSLLEGPEIRRCAGSTLRSSDN